MRLFIAGLFDENILDELTRVSLMRSERGKNGMIYTEIGSVGE